MNTREAKQDLETILNNQKSISIPKLRKLLKTSYFHEISLLKSENKKLKKKVNRQINELSRLKGHG